MDTYHAAYWSSDPSRHSYSDEEEDGRDNLSCFGGYLYFTNYIFDYFYFYFTTFLMKIISFLLQTFIVAAKSTRYIVNA